MKSSAEYADMEEVRAGEDRSGSEEGPTSTKRPAGLDLVIRLEEDISWTSTRIPKTKEAPASLSPCWRGEAATSFDGKGLGLAKTIGPREGEVDIESKILAASSSERGSGRRGVEGVMGVPLEEEDDDDDDDDNRPARLASQFRY